MPKTESKPTPEYLLALIERCQQYIHGPEAEIERLRAKHERALAKADGVDYREGHFRDNTTPDELRDIVLGLALEIDDAKHAVELAESEVAGRDQQIERLSDSEEAAWGLIANAYGGNWELASEASGWRKAAERWRDKYHENLPAAADDRGEGPL